MPQLIKSSLSLRIKTENSDRLYRGFATDASEESLKSFAAAVNSIQNSEAESERKIIENLYSRSDIVG